MMTIHLHTITVRELVDGFVDNDEEGVYGYGGRLTIRPEFQRNFVYNDHQQKEVINSVMKGFPLNVMYWVQQEDGTFEMLDGQQRTMSICSYYNSEFAVDVDGDRKFIENLTSEQCKAFLDYKLQIYICENSTDKEILDWFRIINIAGEQLTDQELLNATYHGRWLSSAKRIFSKNGCYAYNKGGNYVKGTPNRQEILSTVLLWLCHRDGIERKDEYMARHQYDDNADYMKDYFTAVIDWVESLFPDYDKTMKGIEWGRLYNRYKDEQYDKAAVRKRAKELLHDLEVTKYAGIYEYILGGETNRSLLSLRTFDEPTKRLKYKEQKGLCAICRKPFAYKEMQGDHILPWSKGGTTITDNCQMLCTTCNLAKSNH